MSNYSHKAVSVISLAHHLPAVTQPVSPKVKSQPWLDVTVSLWPFHTRCLGRAPAFMFLTAGAGTWFSRVHPSDLLLDVLCGFSFSVKSICVAPLFGPWGEKQQSLPSSCAWFAQPGSQVCRYLISNVVPKSLCASGLCSLLTQGVF